MNEETEKLRVERTGVESPDAEAGDACTQCAARIDEQGEQDVGRAVRLGMGRMERLLQRGRGSKLSTLSDEQLMKLDTWLHEEELPYRKVQVLLKDEFGISISLGALSKHAKRAERWEADIDELKNMAVQMEGVFKELGCSVDAPLEGMMKLIGMNGIRLALDEPENLKAQIAVARLLMQFKKLSAVTGDVGRGVGKLRECREMRVDSPDPNKNEQGEQGEACSEVMSDVGHVTGERREDEQGEQSEQGEALTQGAARGGTEIDLNNHDAKVDEQGEQQIMYIGEHKYQKWGKKWFAIDRDECV